MGRGLLLRRGGPLGPERTAGRPSLSRQRSRGPVLAGRTVAHPDSLHQVQCPARRAGRVLSHGRRCWGAPSRFIRWVTRRFSSGAKTWACSALSSTCCCWRRRWCSWPIASLFLIAWEMMALTAYCLVSFEHEKPETRQAGVLFFVMSHIGAGLRDSRLSAAVSGFGRLQLRQLAWLGRENVARQARRRVSCCSCSASASRPASCRCTSGCRRRIRSRPATSPPSCPAC